MKRTPMRYRCNSCNSILLASEVGLAYKSGGKMIKYGDYDFSDVRWIEIGFNYCKKCGSDNVDGIEESNE
jgi:hypothetical protein